MNPRDNWGPAEWSAYVKEAQGQAVAGIVETGKRLKEAHEAYLREPRRWGRSWDKWCKEELGLARTTASSFEFIQEGVSNADHFPLLPPSWTTLYEVAQFAKEAPEAFEAALDEGLISPSTKREQVERLRKDHRLGIRREQKRERMEASAVAEDRNRREGVDWSVDHCDFRNWKVAPGSVDLVLTDPPYAEEYLEDYYDLATLAHEWLAPEGWCAVMVGQRHLPKFLQALSSGPLEYVWTFGLAHSQSRATGIQFIEVQSVWKPLVLLRKGNPKLGWTADMISYEWTPKDGDHHKWQQEISPFQKLIRAMTYPGAGPEAAAIVADPFCGSGTTGRAALSTGRRFIGCDEDAASVATAATLMTEEAERSKREKEAETAGSVIPFQDAADRKASAS